TVHGLFPVGAKETPNRIYDFQRIQPGREGAPSLAPTGRGAPPRPLQCARLRTNRAASNVPAAGSTSLIAFEPPSFHSPLARSSIGTGTSSSRRPASETRISASTSGARLVNGTARSGSALRLTA